MKYFFRFFLYIAKITGMILLIALLVYIAFNTAMGISQMYVMVTDGMEARADYVITGDKTVDLTKYFSEKFIQNDELLLDDTYENYNIKSFNHTLSIEWIWCWPWSDTASVTATERITYIDGDMKSEFKTEKQRREKKQIPPPEWENIKYEIKFVKVNGQWKIDSLRFLELAKKEDEITRLTLPPTATPSASPGR